MIRIKPSNGGVVLDITRRSPDDMDLDQTAPRTAWVLAVGGGVPWLRAGALVTYDPTRCQRFSDGVKSTDPRAICEVGVIHQRDILSEVDMIPGIFTDFAAQRSTAYLADVYGPDFVSAMPPRYGLTDAFRPVETPPEAAARVIEAVRRDHERKPGHIVSPLPPVPSPTRSFNPGA